MIVAAAILYKNKTITLPPPHRHHHIIEMLVMSGENIPILGEQGFINEHGEFLCRSEAAIEALHCKQIERLSAPPNLFSEDLW